MRGVPVLPIFIFILSSVVVEFEVDGRRHFPMHGRKQSSVLIRMYPRRSYVIKCCGRNRCLASSKARSTTVSQETDGTKYTDQENLDATNGILDETSGASELDPGGSEITDPQSGEQLPIESQNPGQVGVTTPINQQQTITNNNPGTTLNRETTIVNDLKTTPDNAIKESTVALNNDPKTTLAQGSQTTLNSAPQTTLNSAPQTTVQNVAQTTLHNAAQTTLYNNVESTTASGSSSNNLSVTTLSKVSQSSAETTLNSGTRSPVQSTNGGAAPATVSPKPTTTLESTTTTAKSFKFSQCKAICPAQCSCNSDTDVLLDANGAFAGEAVTNKLHGEWKTLCGWLKDTVNITRLNQNIAAEEFAKTNVSDYICCYNCIKMTDDEINEHECIVGMDVVRMDDTATNDKVKFDKGTRQGNCSMITAGKYQVTVNNINKCRPELKLGNAGDGGSACPTLNTWQDCPMSMNVPAYAPNSDKDCTLTHDDSVVSPTCRDRTDFDCIPLTADGVCNGNFPYDTNKVQGGKLIPMNGYGTWAPITAGCSMKYLHPKTPNVVTWVEATRICRDLGMQMPIPVTGPQKDCLAQALKWFNFATYKWAWISSRAVTANLGTWQYCTASHPTYSKNSADWLTGNPDLTNFDQECVKLTLTSALVNDLCTNTNRVICSIALTDSFGF